MSPMSPETLHRPGIDARRRAMLATALAAMAAAGEAAAASPAPNPPLKAGVFDPPRAAPEVMLQGSDGRPLSLAQHRGKLLLVAFGFTNCAAVCPTTLATLAQARKDLGPAGAEVQVVFVTVDPERDDAARMKPYLAAFDPGFIGATGKADDLARVRQAFGVSATKVTMGSSYAVDHSSSVYLIDREGRLRAMMPYGRAAKDYVHDLRILLAAR